MNQRPPFPRLVSFTLTHACPLRCEMCGQHSAEGYVRLGLRESGPVLRLDDWKALVDQVAKRPTDGPCGLLFRGGEPLLFVGVMDLVRWAIGQKLGVSIDTSGVNLDEHADALAEAGANGAIHVTVSVDGPPEVHDTIRGVAGTFARLERGIRALKKATSERGTRVGLSLTCTFTPRNIPMLDQLPDIARGLGVPVVTIVPAYWIPASVGCHHGEVLARELHCEAVSWRGFPHRMDGFDAELFRERLRRFHEQLGEIESYPYMPLDAQEYVDWFTHPEVQVGVPRCRNADLILDVQPDGRANFCVDFVDYFVGNVREQSLVDLWNGEQAGRFRQRLEQGLLPGCCRCGARYIGEQVA